MTTVTLYGKPDCPLCDEAEAELRALIADVDATLEVVDITRDDELFKRYWSQIPVVAFEDGTDLFAPIDDVELREELERIAG